MTLILKNEEIEQILTMQLCIETLDNVYREYGRGKAVDVPRCDAIAPLNSTERVYSLKTMSGCVPYLGMAAIRLTSDVIHWPKVDGKPRRAKIPAAAGQKWVGLVLLFDMNTGEPVAIFPDGIVQRMRVGATSGLAVKYLSREDSRIVALIGSGWQAGAQAMAICETRHIEEIRVYSQTKDHRESFCKEMEPRLGVRMTPVPRPGDAVEGADIIAAATSSMVPVVNEEWVRAGVHVNAINRQELSWEVVSACQPFFIHNKRTLKPISYSVQSEQMPDPGADKRAPGKKNWLDGDHHFPDLADLVSGKVPGRTRADQRTGFLNNMGMGIQFAAVGAKVFEMATRQGLGQTIPTDWFLETVHP
jgi:alanine dehydrogenase